MCKSLWEGVPALLGLVRTRTAWVNDVMLRQERTEGQGKACHFTLKLTAAAVRMLISGSAGPVAWSSMMLKRSMAYPCCP